MCLSTNLKFIAYVLIHKQFFKGYQKNNSKFKSSFLSLNSTKTVFLKISDNLFRRDNKKITNLLSN